MSRWLFVPLALASCASCPPTVADAILDQVYTEPLPAELVTVAVSLDSRGRSDPETGLPLLGECVLMPDGTRVAVIHLGEIAARKGEALSYAWARVVLEHEIAHARMTCTDSDH